MNRADELLEAFERTSGVVGSGDPTGVLRPLVEACGWGTRAIEAPLLPSGVRHGVPFGISFVLGAGAPELRVFLEPQDEPPSGASYWRASERVLAFVAERPGADLSRLARIRDLRAFARAWFTVAFRPDSPPAYRIYLCLDGDAAARARTVREALERVGLADVPRGPKDIPTILSLDLHAAPRTKLYVLEPERLLDHPFARAMPGGDRPMGWLACHFLGGAPRIGWHYGAARHAPDDDELALRLRRFLVERGIDDAPYARARERLGFRHHFVSYQEIGGAPRVTVYQLPEVRRA